MSSAFQVRLHGRGGQGVVTAAEVLALAGFLAGLEAQAFPSFGSERMGAPVTAFCRLSSEPIRVREPVLRPDAVVVLDATLLHHVDLFDGLAPAGFVLINSARSPAELAVTPFGPAVSTEQVVTVPATELARVHTGASVPNIAMLGAFAAVTERVALEHLDRAVGMRLGKRLVAGNVAAMHATYAQAKGLVDA